MALPRSTTSFGSTREVAVSDPAPVRLKRLLHEAVNLPEGELAAERRRRLAVEVLDLLLEVKAAGGDVRLEAGPAVVAPSTGVTRLAEHFRSGAAARATPGVDPAAILKPVLDGLVFSDDDEVEVLRLHAGIRESERWRGLPRELQRAVVALLVARLRRLQDDQRLIHPRLEECFSMLTAYSKREQPGYVVGLSRHHQPVRGSWKDDADAWFERLRAMVEAGAPPAEGPAAEALLNVVTGALMKLEANPDDEAARAAVVASVRAALEGGVSARDPRLVGLVTPVVALFEAPEFRVLRRAARGERDGETAEESVDHEEIPADWAWWGHTRGRRAVLVGGDPRESNRQRIQRAFGFSELDWVETGFRSTSLPELGDRVRGGGADVVIVLGAFLGHETDDVLRPACAEAGAEWVYVDKGYGVVRIRDAFESAGA